MQEPYRLLRVVPLSIIFACFHSSSTVSVAADARQINLDRGCERTVLSQLSSVGYRSLSSDLRTAAGEDHQPVSGELLFRPISPMIPPDSPSSHDSAMATWSLSSSCGSPKLQPRPRTGQFFVE